MGADGGVDMDALWTNELQPFLAERETRRKAMVKRLYIALWVGAGVALILILIMAVSGAFEVGGFLGIAALVAAGAIGGYPLTKLHKEIKLGLLNKLAEAAGMTYAEKPAQATRFEVFREHGLVPHSDRQSYEDHFTGVRHGSAFELYEADLKQRRQQNKKTTYVTVFRGVLIRIEFPRTVEGITVITRDAGWFNGLGALGRSLGGNRLKRVGLVDPKFERIFEVYSTDQVMSRYLLTPTFMERLLALETSLKGKRVRAAFDERHGGGELLIATETGNLFEPGSMFKPLDDKARFDTLLSEIGLVTEIVDMMVKPPELGEAPALES